MTRIAIVGKAGVGKTTIASHLVTHDSFTKAALADKLKEICKDLWPEKFVNGAKPRELLQRIGTEGFRAQDADVWVNYLMRKVDAETNVNRIRDWVVDDARFLNEARILRENGFAIIKVMGPTRIDMPEGTTKHASEVELEQIQPDYEITNVGTLDDLNAAIDSLLLTIRLIGLKPSNT